MGDTMHFFLGANSGCGFQSLFEPFCQKEHHNDLLVLKGGPGCGKSTMMKRIGEEMEARGEQVEYLHCSGDPRSLDGVRIPRKCVAVVDGTAPHVIEPRYPAAVDRYVDLGRFYDISALKFRREEVVQHSESCSRAYRAAYRILSAARSLEENASALALQALDREKLRRRAEGIAAREIKGKGNGEEDRFRFLGSLTCEGSVWRFDSVESVCPRVYHLHDSWGSSAEMLRFIHAAARERMYGCILCPDPEQKDRLQHLLIPELGVAFVTTRSDMECPCTAYRRIHLDAMLERDHLRRWKGRLKFMRNMITSLRGEGVGLLKEAKAAHDALEAVYRPYVDFSSADELIEQEISRIVSC